jgi:hypothetical protein
MTTRFLLFWTACLALACDNADKDEGISSGGDAVDVGGSSDGGDGGSGSGDDGGSGSGDDGGSGSGGSAGSGSGGSGSGGSGDCSVTVLDTYPGSGQSDWHYLTPLEVELNDSDSTARLSLSKGGSSVPGTFSTDDRDRILRFSPDDPLDPSTSYELSISLCSGDVSTSLSFSTSELGTPLDCSLEGKTYRAALEHGRFIKPDPAVASLLFDTFEDDFLLGVFSERGSSLELHAALSDGVGGPQNYCAPSIELGTATWSDPTFEFGPSDLTIEVAGVSIPVSSFYARGTFSPDCSYTGGGRWEGELDARVLAPLVGELLGAEDPDAVCALLTTFGVACEACSSDAEEYCIQVIVEDLQGSAIGTSLSCVSDEDCHPACSSSTCGDPSAGVCD